MIYISQGVLGMLDKSTRPKPFKSAFNRHSRDNHLLSGWSRADKTCQRRTICSNVHTVRAETFRTTASYKDTALFEFRVIISEPASLATPLAMTVILPPKIQKGVSLYTAGVWCVLYSVCHDSKRRHRDDCRPCA
jgi:hypothetical protein